MTQNDSTRTATVWQTDNDVLIPVEVQQESAQVVTEKPQPVRQTAEHKPKVKAAYGVPRLLARPVAPQQEIVAADGVDTAAVRMIEDTAVTDALVTDTVAGEETYGIVLVNPAGAYISDSSQPEEPAMWRWGSMSWIYLVLVLMFCAVSLKFKGSSRYMKAIVADLTDTRLRHNLFDETVKETSLLVLLNLAWVLSTGILLWALVKLTWTAVAPMLPQVICPPGTELDVNEAAGIGICVAVTVIYMLFMMIAYWMVGNVFSDRRKTALWVKGAAASTALETFLFFPLALLVLVYPAWSEPLLWVGAGGFIIGKMTFLYKGFRIFFTEISSWMLFLYYLCSLEVVPLILAYFGAVAACLSW